MKYIKHLPWAIVGIMALYLGSKAMVPHASPNEMDFYAFGKIPVQHGGRIQPLDSVARNALMIITSGRQEYTVIVNGRAQERQAIRWLLEVAGSKSGGQELEVFRVDDPDLRQWIGLKDKPGSYRYSFVEIGQAKRQQMAKRAMELRDKPVDTRTVFESSLIDLFNHVRMWEQLSNMSVSGIIPNPDSPNAKWKTLGDINEEIAQSVGESASAEAEAQFKKELVENRERFETERQSRSPEDFKRWMNAYQMRLSFQILDQASDKARKEAYPQASALMEIFRAYDSNDAKDFNDAVQKYHQEYVSKYSPDDVSKAASEAWMNHFEPFFLCKVCYIMVMVIACLSWLVPQEIPVGKSAFYLACLTLGVHTTALILRMFIGSRPPVTNLYSSAVFIGWGCLVLCLIMEKIYKNSLGSFVGGLTGMATMQIAQLLSQGGDTLEMLVAVLDTNFWLATHVTIVTLGYTATFVAGFLGAAYIFAGMFTTALRKDGGRAIYQMTYGTVCFATLLSFVGTVLGGIWADQSWGRFWGWDPKENGAVLIVIWNALALHARWAGMVKGRGFAVLTVFGNVVTAWSWFGTNQLGIGLHAYGFNKTLATSCAVFWISQCLIMVLGIVPLKFWASFTKESA